MRIDFERWMKTKNKYVPGTVRSYSTAINRISQHYSIETGRNIDIYKIKDIPLLREICTEYDRDGRFEVFGDKNNGLCRAAILAYARYFEQTGSSNDVLHEEINFSISNGKITVKRNSTGKIAINISLLMEEVKK